MQLLDISLLKGFLSWLGQLQRDQTAFEHNVALEVNKANLDIGVTSHKRKMESDDTYKQRQLVTIEDLYKVTVYASNKTTKAIQPRLPGSHDMSSLAERRYKAGDALEGLGDYIKLQSLHLPREIKCSAQAVRLNCHKIIDKLERYSRTKEIPNDLYGEWIRVYEPKIIASLKDIEDKYRVIVNN